MEDTPWRGKAEASGPLPLLEAALLTGSSRAVPEQQEGWAATLLSARAAGLSFSDRDTLPHQPAQTSALRPPLRPYHLACPDPSPRTPGCGICHRRGPPGLSNWSGLVVKCFKDPLTEGGQSQREFIDLHHLRGWRPSR